jgi:hypothetical protein
VHFKFEQIAAALCCGLFAAIATAQVFKIRLLHGGVCQSQITPPSWCDPAPDLDGRRALLWFCVQALSLVHYCQRSVG